MFQNKKVLVSISSVGGKNQLKMMNEKSRSSHQEVCWKNRVHKHLAKIAGKCLFIQIKLKNN